MHPVGTFLCRGRPKFGKMTVRNLGQESYPLGTFKKKLPNFHFIKKISYGIAENVIMKLSEENPHKYFVLSRYSHKSQQYGIFVVTEVGNLDMEAKTRKIVFSGKKLMLAANKAHLEAAQNCRGIIQNSRGITFLLHPRWMWSYSQQVPSWKILALFISISGCFCPRHCGWKLQRNFIQQSVVTSSKAVVEDVAESNMPNAAVKVAVLISKEIQCSADVKAIGLYRATFICFENSGCCIVSEMLFYNVFGHVLYWLLVASS